MKEPSFAVCVRVDQTDNPVEGSTQDKCARCETGVWVSIATRLYVKDEDATILCWKCGMQEMADQAEKGEEVEIVTTEVQQREIHRGLLERGL